MTEDEAKTKWCPHARMVETGPNGNSVARNRVTKVDAAFENPTVHADTLAGAQCIASACMAWRWSEGKRAEAFHEAVRAHMRTQAKPNAATATQEVYAARGHEFERTEGVCGLAGAPQ